MKSPLCATGTEATLARAKRAHPDARLTTDPCEVLTSPNIDAVAVVTPVWTHFELAKAALNNGKHIFVEKPFTSTAAQAEELIELAEKKNLRIMVDHTFLFTGAVRKIRQLIDDGTMGKLYYYDSMRVNLGLFQHDVNVIWDLAPHDLSIMSHLITEEPDVVIATGAVHFNGLEDVAYITVYFRGKVIAHINVNWLSPVKVRTTLIGGEKKMLVWNDLDADEKVKVYDKGVQISNGTGRLRSPGQLSYRRHVGAEGGADRGAGSRDQVLHRLHFEWRDAFQRWNGRAASRANPGSRKPVTEGAGKAGPTMKEHLCIAPDVRLGENVRLSQFINLYGCEIGDNTKIGAFVEIQKNSRVGKNCKISSHTFICEGVTIEDGVFIGHGVTFINDTYPRAATDDGKLQTEADWKVETTLVKKGASIGSGATILSSVTVGENAIVGAGSVVTKRRTREYDRGRQPGTRVAND